MNQEGQFPEFLKIAVMNYPVQLYPYVLSMPGNKTLYIEDAKLIALLSETLDFKYEIISAEENDYGKPLTDGNWTGLIGIIQREEADLAISYVGLTYDRSLAVPFSYPYSFRRITFITDNLEYFPDNYRILHPFSSCVWLAVGFSLLSMLLVSFLFRNRRGSFQNMLMNVYGALLAHSVNFDAPKLSAKLFVMSWFIGGILISQSYMAFLLSFLTLPTLSGVRNINELS